MMQSGCSAAQSGSIPRLSEKQFVRQAAQPNTVILDVRTPKEYEAAHIGGSILIDYLNTEKFTEEIQKLDSSKNYLLYCRTGKRSLHAAYLMKSKGFKKVSDLKEGITGWHGPVVIPAKIK
jgi:rhodanese-related sulfurtransferase